MRLQNVMLLPRSVKLDYVSQQKGFWFESQGLLFSEQEVIKLVCLYPTVKKNIWLSIKSNAFIWQNQTVKSGFATVACKLGARISLRRFGLPNSGRRNQKFRIQPVKLFPLRLRHLHGLRKQENLRETERFVLFAA